MTYGTVRTDTGLACAKLAKPIVEKILLTNDGQIVYKNYVSGKTRCWQSSRDCLFGNEMLGIYLYTGYVIELE
jgi:hypothetical protein